MNKGAFVQFLRNLIPNKYWEIVWWIVPLSAIFVLPVGLPVTYVLTMAELDGAPRLTQLLILSSVFYGPVSGTLVLLLVKHAGLSVKSVGRISWLARIAVVTPVLIILTLFLIFSR